MEVCKTNHLLLRCRAGTPAPNLLKDAKKLRGAGELKYPATASEAGVGVDLGDKPPSKRANTSGPHTTEVGFLLGFSRHINRRAAYTILTACCLLAAPSINPPLTLPCTRNQPFPNLLKVDVRKSFDQNAHCMICLESFLPFFSSCCL